MPLTKLDNYYHLTWSRLSQEESAEDNNELKIIQKISRVDYSLVLFYLLDLVLYVFVRLRIVYFIYETRNKKLKYKESGWIFNQFNESSF